MVSDRTRRILKVVSQANYNSGSQLAIHFRWENGHGGSHSLPKQDIGLRLATIRLIAVTEELTVCRIKPSSSDLLEIRSTPGPSPPDGGAANVALSFCI